MDQFNLNQNHYEIIEGIGDFSEDNSRLTSDHIEAFIKLVSIYSDYRIQSSLLLQNPTSIQPIDMNTKSIQLLYSGESDSGHWICVYYENYKLHIYDSLNFNNIHTDHKIFLNRMLPIKTNINLIYEKVHHQKHASYIRCVQIETSSKTLF